MAQISNTFWQQKKMQFFHGFAQHNADHCAEKNLDSCMRIRDARIRIIGNLDEHDSAINKMKCMTQNGRYC
jgi:hypothetical protein